MFGIWIAAIGAMVFLGALIMLAAWIEGRRDERKEPFEDAEAPDSSHQFPKAA